MKHQEQPRTAGQNGPAPRRRRGWKIAVAVLLLLALLASAGAFYYYHKSGGDRTPTEEIRESLKSIADSTEIMGHARALKSSLKRVAASLKEMDTAGARDAQAGLERELAETRSLLESPSWKAAALLPVVGDELKSVRELLSILDDADRELLDPALALLEQEPLSSLRADEGFRVGPLLRYLDLLEALLPQARTLAERLAAVDLSLVDMKELEEASQALSAGLDLGDELLAYVPAVRAVLGGGSDRLYLFGAQASAEIRASGGFVGSMGIIRIRDGVLSLSDFESVYHILFPVAFPKEPISEVEEKIFGGRMHESWDSDFSPDFERAASIWAQAYEYQNRQDNVHVDGVVSATPAVINRLLSFLGGFTLSDGTEVNGENAARVIGHDLYFKYYGMHNNGYANYLVDNLFAECARQTLDLAMSRVSFSLLPDYLNFFKESFADRTLMVWMADEAEQQHIRDAGWAAGLNKDPEKPRIGIFFNSTVSSKMGWYLNMEPTLSDPAVEEDGSRSYLVTVRLSSAMTKEERSKATRYVLGGTQGITGIFYIFAPAGGHILSMEADNDWKVNREVYEDLELGYLAYMTVFDARPITVTCRLTTAPGVEAEPGFMMTPTMQNYR